MEQFVYLGEHAGVELAERFYAAVDETCALLVKQPNSGARCDSSIKRLEEMGRDHVSKWRNS